MYDDLLEKAAGLLDAGINVIVDAAFLDADRRLLARRIADAHNVSFVMVQTLAGNKKLRQRLAQRTGSGDASEADARVLDYQLEKADPISADERHLTVSVDTETVVEAAEVAARIKALR